MIENKNQTIFRGAVLGVAVFAVAFLFLYVLSSQAAVNEKINYQGLLADSAGTAVADGSYTLHLKIYTLAGGGSPLWSADPVVTTKNGVFSTLLDVSTLNFDGSAFYLGVAVNADPEMTPRKEIGSVPQAINANNLIGDGMINISGDAEIGGNVGIGTSSSTSITQDIFTGTGLDDLTSGGTFTGATDKNYVVTISTVAGTDKFQWSDDGGSTWSGEVDIDINGASQALSDGVTVTFAAATGHTVADSWSFWGRQYKMKLEGESIRLENPNFPTQYLSLDIGTNSADIKLNDLNGNREAQFYLGENEIYMAGVEGNASNVHFFANNQVSMSIDSPADGSGQRTAYDFSANFSNLNTAGDGYTGFSLNVTDAQAGADGSRNLLDLRLGNASQFLVTSTGNVLANGTLGLLETGDTPTYRTIFQSGDLTGADSTYTWPNSYPASSGYILSSTDAGVMSWNPILGTMESSFTIGTETDSSSTNTTLQFGNTNAETLVFDGANTDNFLLSDDLAITGGLTATSTVTASSLISDELFVQNNVGIGVYTPTASLDVLGSSIFRSGDLTVANLYGSEPDLRNGYPTRNNGGMFEVQDIAGNWNAIVPTDPGTSYLASELPGVVLDCVVSTGQKAGGGACTDNAGPINALLATASEINPIELVIDGGAAMSVVQIPPTGYVTIRGQGRGTGFYIMGEGDGVTTATNRFSDWPSYQNEFLQIWISGTPNSPITGVKFVQQGRDATTYRYWKANISGTDWYISHDLPNSRWLISNALNGEGTDHAWSAPSQNIPGPDDVFVLEPNIEWPVSSAWTPVVGSGATGSPTTTKGEPIVGNNVVFKDFDMNMMGIPVRNEAIWNFGFNIHGIDGMVFDNIYSYDSTTFNVSLYASRNVWIHDSIFSVINSPGANHDGIHLNGGMYNVWIDDVTFFGLNDTMIALNFVEGDANGGGNIFINNITDISSSGNIMLYGQVTQPMLDINVSNYTCTGNDPGPFVYGSGIDNSSLDDFDPMPTVAFHGSINCASFDSIPEPQVNWPNAKFTGSALINSPYKPNLVDDYVAVETLYYAADHENNLYYKDTNGNVALADSTILQNSSTTLFNIDTYGVGYFDNNLGIGDSTPTSLLTVGADDAFQVNSSGQVVAGSWLGSLIDAEYGGTGIDASLAGNGSLLIGNGSGFSLANLTAGNGISITNGAGSITISSAADTALWSLNGLEAYYNSGNVGIGTNDPGARLSVDGGVPSNGSGANTLSSFVVDYSNLATSGDSYTGIKLNVTDTADVDVTSKLLMDLQTGGVSQFSVSSAGDILASGIITSQFASIGTPTYGTVNDFLNFAGTAGRVSGGTINDAGSGNITVDAGTGYIRVGATNISELKAFDWSALGSTAIPVDTVRYVGVNYNGGSPVVEVRVTDSWNYYDNWPLGMVANVGGVIHINQDGREFPDQVGRLIRRFYGTRPYERDERQGGLIIGETGTRNVTLSAGTLWDRSNNYAIPAFDSSGADRFDVYYRDGASGWTLVANQSQWPNTQYDNNSGTLQTATNGRWLTAWFYLETDGNIVMLYGQNQYLTQALAAASTAPATVPARITAGGRLIGRFIFQKSDATALIETVWDSTLNPTLVADHGSLSGLVDDDHIQYALLAGRLGGQTLIGGTDTTDDLILRTTSGTGASGADMIFQTGDNGTTEAMRILNSGNVGIGTYPTHVGFPVFAGTGADDLTSGGTFTGTAQTNYRIEIDGKETGTGGVDTFKWSDDGGSTWNASTVDITGAAQPLNNGVIVTFGATTGHEVADYWDFQGNIYDLKVDGVMAFTNGAQDYATARMDGGNFVIRTGNDNSGSRGDVNIGREGGWWSFSKIVGVENYNPYFEMSAGSYMLYNLGKYQNTGGDDTAIAHDFSADFSELAQAGDTWTGIKLNVTNTAESIGSKLLMDLQTGSVSQFSVSSAGSITTTLGDGTLSVVSGVITSSSDERLKDISGYYTNGLEAILNINPIEYNWNEQSGLDPENLHIGFSAQNIQEVIPEAVGVDRRGFLTLSDRPILAAAINAIQEQQGLIITQQSINLDQESILTNLNLQTTGNITTLEGLTTSVKERFGSVEKMLNDQGEAIENQTALLNIQQTEITALENTVVTLQGQIQELQARLNTETNLAQIDLNAQDMTFVKLLLGIDRVASPEDVDILGKLSARTISTGGIEIVIDPQAPTIGNGIIPADKSMEFVETEAVAPESKIYVTPIGSTDNQVLYVGDIDLVGTNHENKKGFEVRVDRINGVVNMMEVEGVEAPVTTPLIPKDIEFNWWIIQTN